MVKNLLSAMCFLILAMIMVSDPVYADPLRLNCLVRNHYMPSSPFEKNLKLLLQSLSSNTSLNKGYYNSSIGNATTPRVYGKALCRGDSSPAVCQNCTEHASQEILKKCKSEEAIIWYEDCQIHYSSRNFLTNKMGYYFNYPESNNQRKAITTAGFDEVLSYLIRNLTSEASADPSMFAVGQISFRNSENIYGLAQCTRDVSASDCKNCLNSALGDLHACCSGHEGGILVSAYCNLRYEPYQFYNAASILVTYPTSAGENTYISLFVDCDVPLTIYVFFFPLFCGEYESKAGGKLKIGIIMVIACISIFVLAVFIGSSFVYLKCKKGAQTDETNSQIVLLQNLARPKAVSLAQEGDLVSYQDLPFINLAIIRAATDEFSDSHKLGQGGFGTVYKGVLPDGKEVAVKRLSRKSGQGLEELKNEIILIAKLQHRNLVRLLACGIEGDEKLLIYEYMPNKSLDLIIFDPEKRSRLDWMICYSIIGGIARGLLYLHEDSRLKIIHRDLKPSNILLDEEMVAKISDFGMARIFYENQNTANTKRVAGTYGYMAPEYAMEGLFSVKSDVFSFGVILLEIISGKKNSGFYVTGLAPTLLAYAWQLWNEGKELEFVDPFLMQSCSTQEVLRSLQIGLLCVQEDPASRPTMSSVVAVLQNDPSVALPEPRKPAFSMSRIVSSDESSTTNHSMSEMATSTMSPR